MKKQEFIDSLHDAGWEGVHDAQWTEVGKLWRKLFPTVAKVTDEMDDAIEMAHMAGQNNANGCDPSYSEAFSYRKKVTG